MMKLGLGFAIPIILAIMIFEMRDGKLKKFIQTVSYIPHFFLDCPRRYDDFMAVDQWVYQPGPDVFRNDG